MLCILKEKHAVDIFENYRNAAAFTLAKNGAKGATIGDVEITYEKLNFLPSEDTINAIRNGDKKLKKVIKNAVHALEHPSMDNAEINLGMIQLITMLTSTRKAKRGPVVIVFIRDEEDEKRNEILTKFLKGVLKEFGIRPVTDSKLVHKLFAKRKKAPDRVAKYSNKKDSGCRLSGHGAELKKLNQIFFEMELRQSAMAGLAVSDLGKSTADVCVKALAKIYTCENLKLVDKKTAKRLADKNKESVDAYQSLREILHSMDSDMKLPKVEFGQKRKFENKKDKKKYKKLLKKGSKKKAQKFLKKNAKPVGPKLNVKKFKKFYLKRENRGILILIYAHTLAILLGLEPGQKDYNSHMKSVCTVFEDGFGKAFTAAATAYAKRDDSASKDK